MSEEKKQHWADEAAEAMIESGRIPVLSTGISPSGQIHIGNMREVLTADAVYRALKDRLPNVGFNYIADNFDPLRKVYPFLDEATYAPLVGQPLSDIPCPCGDHKSYSDHFLEPFLRSLDKLGVDVEVMYADRMYKTGLMTPYIILALEHRDEITSILHEMTGKQFADGWSPFTPWCPQCRKISDAEVLGFSAESETIDYRCGCGSSGTVPMAGGGKLTWRIDWPARWSALGVTLEPFGKDHATRGGSYDTGKAIAERVFRQQAPQPVPYEWIRLKGKGDMSSSRGNVLSINEMLEVVPPEILRYLVIRARPQKTIAFDPGLPLLKLVDEFESMDKGDRAVELSSAAGFTSVGVPFKHLVVVAQIAKFDPSNTQKILETTGYMVENLESLRERLHYVRNWLERFAPEELKFEVRSTLPQEVAELTVQQRGFLRKLAEGLRPGMSGDEIHTAIYDAAKEEEGVKPGELFRAVYISLLGKERGPRAGGFIESLGIDWCTGRFREAGESH